MVAYTTAKNIIQPANSSYVGTWDQPVNSNWGVIDAALGQTVNVSLNNSPVTLSANQYQCYNITFNSTLTGNVAITFPSSFTGPYSIFNACTGSTSFVVTLQTTVSSGQAVACPYGEFFDVYNDGTNVKFRNFGRIGSYWDYAGSSVPTWVTTCTVPPYLNCDGTTFSSATYPFLSMILGGTTLPDARGRYRAALNQGQSRITSGSSTGGVDGDTLLASGGAQTVALSSQNVPPLPLTLTDPGHTHLLVVRGNNNNGTGQARGGDNTGATATETSCSATTGITITGGSSSNTNFSILPPSYVGGLTLIRAG